MIGNEEDFIEALGFHVKGIDENFTDLNLDGYSGMFTEAAQTFPNIKIIATTLRSVTSASKNDWSAIAWSPESGLVQSRAWKDLEIFDRVGGGDSFASGLIYGLMSGHDLQKSLNLGAAHGAFAMTTPGDTSMATKSEVEKLAAGGSARVQR
jgi:2-dehydro-3-deoxygluconokinase